MMGISLEVWQEDLVPQLKHRPALTSDLFCPVGQSVKEIVDPVTDHQADPRNRLPVVSSLPRRQKVSSALNSGL